MALRQEVQNTAQEVPQEPVAPNEDDLDLKVLARKTNQTLLQKDHARKKLAEVYRQEPKESVMIAPMYAPYFGKVMHVMVNGISIAVPCDGRPYDVPRTFASEVLRRINAINDQQSKAKRYSDVHANIEGAPGELALF